MKFGTAIQFLTSGLFFLATLTREVAGDVCDEDGQFAPDTTIYYTISDNRNPDSELFWAWDGYQQKLWKNLDENKKLKLTTDGTESQAHWRFQQKNDQWYIVNRFSGKRVTIEKAVNNGQINTEDSIRLLTAGAKRDMRLDISCFGDGVEISLKKNSNDPNKGFARCAHEDHDCQEGDNLTFKYNGGRRWDGTAPFCDGSCPNSWQWQQLGSCANKNSCTFCDGGDNPLCEGFGSDCTTGTKKFCEKYSIFRPLWMQEITRKTWSIKPVETFTARDYDPALTTDEIVSSAVGADSGIPGYVTQGLDIANMVGGHVKKGASVLSAAIDIAYPAPSLEESLADLADELTEKFEEMMVGFTQDTSNTQLRTIRDTVLIECNATLNNIRDEYENGDMSLDEFEEDLEDLARDTLFGSASDYEVAMAWLYVDPLNAEPPFDNLNIEKAQQGWMFLQAAVMEHLSILQEGVMVMGEAKKNTPSTTCADILEEFGIERKASQWRDVIDSTKDMLVENRKKYDGGDGVMLSRFIEHWDWYQHDDVYYCVEAWPDNEAWTDQKQYWVTYHEQGDWSNNGCGNKISNGYADEINWDMENWSYRTTEFVEYLDGFYNSTLEACELGKSGELGEV